MTLTKRSFLLALLTVTIVVSCSTNSNKSNAEAQLEDSATNKSLHKMKNLVSIIEIPTSDLKRAISFYKSILGINIEEAEMGGVKMGILPGEEGTVNVVLVNGSDYKPTSNGNIIYLNGGDNLQTILDKIESNGGKIITPKTEISPEMGFFALFTDTEGNKLGLHSLK